MCIPKGNRVRISFEYLAKSARLCGSAGVRPSKVGKLMGSNGETDKCTEGRADGGGETNNPIKKRETHCRSQRIAFQILLGGAALMSGIRDGEVKSPPLSSLSLISLMISKRYRWYSSIFEWKADWSAFIKECPVWFTFKFHFYPTLVKVKSLSIKKFDFILGNEPIEKVNYVLVRHSSIIEFPRLLHWGFLGWFQIEVGILKILMILHLIVSSYNIQLFPIMCIQTIS